MSLFERPPQKNAGEDLVFSKMYSGDLMRLIIDDIHQYSQKEDGYWLMGQTNYYDDRERTVLIDENGIVIKKCAASKIKNANEELAKSKRIATWAISDAKFRKAEETRERAMRQLESIENMEEFPINYTLYGYTPLPMSYIDQQQRIGLYRQQLLPVWAKAVKERIKVWHPTCEFSNVTQLANIYMFWYKVPEWQWKSWF